MFSQTHLQRRVLPAQSDKPFVSSQETQQEREAAKPYTVLGQTLPSSPKPPESSLAALNTNEQETTTPLIELHFNPLSHSRASSVYTLGRSSFAGKLSILTSVDLPDPSTLSATVAAIPTALEVCRTLQHAAPQIKRWIQTAAKVLGELDAQDDIEWAAGGIESVPEAEAAINKFAEVINVYVDAITEVEKREDVSKVPKAQLEDVVSSVEEILPPWEEVKQNLQVVKNQVALVVEWEELWNKVCADISNELGELLRMYYRAEEARHNEVEQQEEEAAEVADTVVRELETIAEDGPAALAPEGSQSAKRSLAVSSLNVSSPAKTSSVDSGSDNSMLLALIARMQPLQASINFLPMRLATFRSKAVAHFSAACDELDERRADLESQMQQLEKHLETYQAELAEDKWLYTFREAGARISKMCQSVEHTMVKLQEALDSGANLGTPAATLTKRIRDYEAKKNTVLVNIPKLIEVFKSSANERKTVNGHIIMIQENSEDKWHALQLEIQDLDARVEEFQNSRGQQELRESVSTISTQDMSSFESTLGTPGSSPASSVVMSISSQPPKDTPSTPDLGSRTPSIRSLSSSLPAAARRNASLPISSRYLSPSTCRTTSNSSTPSVNGRASTTTTPTAVRRLSQLSTPTSAPQSNRPRWSSSTVVDYNRFGSHSRPESRIVRSSASTLSTPTSPLIREHSASPSPSLTVPRARAPCRAATSTTSGLGVHAPRGRKDSSRSPSRTDFGASTPAVARPRQHTPGALMASRMAAGVANRRSVTGPTTLQTVSKEDDATGVAEATRVRPTSRLMGSTGAGRRSSMLPVRGADDKPRWR